MTIVLSRRLLVLLLPLVVSMQCLGQSSGKFTTIQWTDLIPEDDLQALLNPPEYLDDISDGSPQDLIANQIRGAIEQASDSRYRQALTSTRIIAEYHGRYIRMPGFIVPLEHGENQKVTQFFLVPYFGACIHLPPPPPNQIVLVDYPRGLDLADIYQPFWISGEMETTVTENELATAAYRMTAEVIQPYMDEP